MESCRRSENVQKLIRISSLQIQRFLFTPTYDIRRNIKVGNKKNLLLNRKIIHEVRYFFLFFFFLLHEDSYCMQRIDKSIKSCCLREFVKILKMFELNNFKFFKMWFYAMIWRQIESIKINSKNNNNITWIKFFHFHVCFWK